MTTDKTPIRALIEAVEAGTATDFLFLTWRPGLTGTKKESRTMIRAYHGSLDAALALHEALLPGWSCAMNTNGGAQTISPRGERWHGQSSDAPSRAWLLAILKAYEAQQ